LNKVKKKQVKTFVRIKVRIKELSKIIKYIKQTFVNFVIANNKSKDLKTIDNFKLKK